MIDPTGFGVDLRWRVAKAGGNRVSKFTRVEQVDLEKVDGHAIPSMLVLAQGELDRFQPNVVFPNVDPLIALLIGLEFLIGELSWADFTYEGTFFSLSTLTL